MTKKRNLKRCVVMAVFLLGLAPAIAAGDVIYVDADASTGGDGQTWGTAYKYLQDALDDAVTDDEIWVAAGIYKPDDDDANHPDGSGLRTDTFQLINGVGIYGGFPAGGGTWEQRYPSAYETILSGDLSGNDVQVDPCDLLAEPTRAENSFHVVTGGGTDATAGLDGFTITGGNANGLVYPDNYGGGMNNHWSSPTVTNCTFSGNSASGNGGGMYNDNNSSPTVTNCTFSGNSVINGSGGGMYNSGGSPTVTNCTFSDNLALYGGGMSNLGLSSTPTLTNCTFSGNSATERGGGMYNYWSDLNITDCTFSGNLAGSGGGMHNRYGSPTVTNCTFTGNSALAGGGMSNWDSSLTVTNCTFSGNSAENGGGMHNSGGSPIVSNCTFSGNSAGNSGGGMDNYNNSSPTVTNCTFSGNLAMNGAGMVNISNSSPTITNCILWGNTAVSGWPQIFNINSTPSVTYSDIAGGYSGTGNINADPLFIDPNGLDGIPGTADDDLHLQAGSPCIDAGDNTAVLAGVTTDLDGNPRFLDDPLTTDTGQGTAPIVELGRDEYGLVCVDAGATGVNNGSTWKNAYIYLQDALADSAASGKSILVAEGIYKPDRGGGQTLWNRGATFQLINDVAIYGGFPSGGGTWEQRDPSAYETILSGDIGMRGNTDNSYHVVTGSGTDPNAILDGFTIIAGNADGSHPYNKGGGMYNYAGSPTVANCTFSYNSAYGAGGGMYIGSGNPTVVNCIFSGNGANMGGGLSTSASSSVTVVNCVFTANTGGNSGGGILSNGSLIVTNSVFYRNQVTPGMGGAISNWTDSTLTVQNSILWSNLPDEIFVLSGSSAPVVSYSDVEGGYSGTGNIDDDPLFKDADGPDDIPGTEDDNLELAAGSPCIDAGDNNSVPADTADLDEDGNTSERTPLDLGGNARFTDDPVTVDTGNPAPGYPEIVEMGAYERYEFCGDAGYPFPVGDLSHDCKVNFLDIAIIAAHWLEYAGPE